MAQFEIYLDRRDEYRWRLKAANGKKIATSGEGYVSKRDCKHGISLVKSLAPNAPIKTLVH